MKTQSLEIEPYCELNFLSQEIDPNRNYLQEFEGLFLQDAWMGLIKPFFIGFAIVTIGCHVGLRTSGGTQGVGRATTNAVVAASVAVIAVDFFVTRVLIPVLY